VTKIILLCVRHKNASGCLNIIKGNSVFFFHRGKAVRGVKLTTLLHLLTWVKNGGAITPLPYTRGIMLN
jgi:hypothetical protein